MSPHAGKKPECKTISNTCTNDSILSISNQRPLLENVNKHYSDVLKMNNSKIQEIPNKDVIITSQDIKLNNSCNSNSVTSHNTNTNINQNSNTENKTTNENFQIVQKRRRNKIIIGKSTNKVDIQVLSKLSWYFLSRLAPDTTSAQILVHLKSIKSHSNLTCEKLKSKYNHYVSFKIGIPDELKNELLKPKEWPAGIFINDFYAKKSTTGYFFTQDEPDTRNVITRIHQNTRSICNKFQDFEIFYNAVKHWVRKENLQISSISNFYIGSTFFRQSAKGGGSFILVRNKLKQAILILSRLSEQNFILSVVP